MRGVDGRSPKGDEGFTLIEVLVSLTILSVGLLGMALFQITAIKGNANAMNLTIATEVAQAKLETFRRTPKWSDIVSSDTDGYGNSATATVPDYTKLPGAAGDTVPQLRGGKTFYRVWRVVPNNPAALVKTITVWACWQDDRGAWHSVMLVALRTSLGQAP